MTHASLVAVAVAPELSMYVCVHYGVHGATVTVCGTDMDDGGLTLECRGWSCPFLTDKSKHLQKVH